LWAIKNQAIDLSTSLERLLGLMLKKHCIESVWINHTIPINGMRSKWSGITV